MCLLEDATEIIQGRPYHWKDWCLIRSRDCLYLWNESCALELSNGSNGWFRFILDNKLATMYSSGSPEGGSDSSGCSKVYSFYLLLSLDSHIGRLSIFLIGSSSFPPDNLKPTDEN